VALDKISLSLRGEAGLECDLICVTDFGSNDTAITYGLGGPIAGRTWRRIGDNPPQDLRAALIRFDPEDLEKQFSAPCNRLM
jgi:hypothetical protein